MEMLALPILALIVPTSANRLFLMARGGVLEVESKEWDGERATCAKSGGAVVEEPPAVEEDGELEGAAFGRCSSLSVGLAKRLCWEVAPSRLEFLDKEFIVPLPQRPQPALCGRCYPFSPL